MISNNTLLLETASTALNRATEFKNDVQVIQVKPANVLAHLKFSEVDETFVEHWKCAWPDESNIIMFLFQLLSDFVKNAGPGNGFTQCSEHATNPDLLLYIARLTPSLKAG